MTNNSKSKHIETVRSGSIGAGIFLKTKKDGTHYHAFTLTRAFKNDGEEKFSYSTEFYPRNGNALSEAASEAAEKCKELDSLLEPSDQKTAA